MRRRPARDAAAARPSCSFAKRQDRVSAENLAGQFQNRDDMRHLKSARLERKDACCDDPVTRSHAMSVSRIAAILVLIGFLGFVAVVIAHADQVMVFALFVGATAFITLGVVIFLAEAAFRFWQELRSTTSSDR
jgi:Flp pilus assembly protein TadB